jgi:exopolyphosphatase/guanosine-5'-triphosphate,3'-diphosphate pyrophosphatase
VWWEQFIVKAEQALGHKIHVIAGVEEARLIYLGVANSLSSNANSRLVMDIGGGSTEYIIGTDDIPRIKESLNMGCVTVSNRFFADGILSKRAFKQAVLYAEQHLEPHQDNFDYQQWDEAIGASGSLKAIDRVLHATGWSNNGITFEGLEKLVEEVTSHSHISQINLPELGEDRLPVFVGGLAITYGTFKALGIEQMTVSEGALREGLIHDLLGRIYNRDIRSQTVQSLATNYHTDKIHSARIKQTVLYMFAQLNISRTQQDYENINQFLGWAADLHEIGRDIAHSQYHKHGAYVIANGDLAGFSQRDQILLATLVASHRKKISLSTLKRLPSPWSYYTPILVILLRLAVVFHRNRHTLELPDFKISINKPHISVVFPQNWLSQAPLTQADLVLEANYLEMAGFYLTYC